MEIDYKARIENRIKELEAELIKLNWEYSNSLIL